MSGLFLHKENQNILWNFLHKSPYFIEFQQKYPNQKTEFFNQAMASISREMYFHPTTVEQLTEINKEALGKMIGKLKQVLGYSAWNQYNVGDEKTQRVEAMENKFNQYEQQYHEMLKAPKAPDLDLNLGIKDGKLSGDMEELIKRQTEMRERDIYIPPPPSAAAALLQQQQQQSIQQLKSVSSKSSPHGIPDILKPVATKSVYTEPATANPPRLKITEEEEPITVDKEFGVDGGENYYRYSPTPTPTPDGFNIRQELETRGSAIQEYHGVDSPSQYHPYDLPNKIHMAIGAPPSTQESANKQVRWVDETV